MTIRYPSDMSTTIYWESVSSIGRGLPSKTSSIEVAARRSANRCFRASATVGPNSHIASDSFSQTSRIFKVSKASSNDSAVQRSFKILVVLAEKWKRLLLLSECGTAADSINDRKSLGCRLGKHLNDNTYESLSILLNFSLWYRPKPRCHIFLRPAKRISFLNDSGALFLGSLYQLIGRVQSFGSFSPDALFVLVPCRIEVNKLG